MKILCLLALLVLLAAAKNFTFYQHTDPAAKCLDGTQPGFYFQKGRHSDKFLVYFQGGALCSGLTQQDTLKDCYSRSLTNLGSSAQYPKSRSFDNESYLSPLNSNPFHNWNRVFIPYCDGSLHQGSKLQPAIYNGSKLYFRGTNNTLAHFKALDQKFDFFQADEIIISGTSAGGVAAYLWANYVYDNAENQDGVLVVADSATFILDFKNVYGLTFIDVTSSLLKIVNTQVSLPLAQCVAGQINLPVKCFQSGVAVKYIKPRIFFIQSQYDTWGINYILLLTCSPHTNPSSLQVCNTAQKSSIQQYRAKVNEAMSNVTSIEKNGAWSISCAQHGFLEDMDSFISPKYLIPTKKGIDMTKALLGFKVGLKRKYIDKVNWPDNTGCSNLTPPASTPTPAPPASHNTQRHYLASES